ncbi:lytic transglycosylase domain-containing protein [Ideonella sp. DXS29W]|uniref:Lytic transglycosylase domain-containing protein n=1 Tax=Ideonella lacteola TaxID=2984193 RepID=A0ABU9BL37_9BURK
MASAQDAAPSAAAAITRHSTSYRCQFADGVERTLTVNAGQSFPLSVRRCEPIDRPAVDSPSPPVLAPPVPAADDRLPSVTWIEAPTAGRVGHAPHEPVASEAAIEWAPQVRRASQRHGVDAQLVDAVIHVESRHRAAARSPKGALGLMQVMPATGARYGVARAQDLLDPSTNLDVGVRYLRDLLVMFEGRTELALAAYNAGEGNVLRHGLRVPPFPETQGYVEQVLTRYAQLRSTP